MHTFEEMSNSLRVKVQNLNVGEITTPSIIQMQDNNSGYRILKISKREEEHMANIIQDFTTIKNLAMNIKKQEALLEWIDDKIEKTFVRFNNDGMIGCDFKNNWIK